MYGLMLLATLSWGINPVAGKEALTGFAPAALAQLRLIGAALGYLAIFFAWPKRPRLGLRLRDWLFLVMVAALGVTFNQFFFVLGLAKSSVVHSGLIFATGPVMVLVISCLLRLESLTVAKLGGMLISFGGVVFLTMGMGSRADGGLWQGDILYLLGTVTFSGYTVAVKEIVDRFDALTLNTFTFGLGAVLLLPFGVPSVWRTSWGTLPRAAWLGLACMIVFGSLLPYLIYAYALSGLTAARVSAFGYIQPLITAGLGAWWLGEQVSWRLVFCGVAILLGVYVTERARENGPLARSSAS
jgi:drug/metabolite transporter (DMT)-like permease